MALSFRDQLLAQLGDLQVTDDAETENEANDGFLMVTPAIWVAFLECVVHAQDIEFLSTQLQRQHPNRVITVYLEFVGCTFVAGASESLGELLQRGRRQRRRRYEGGRDTISSLRSSATSILVRGLNFICFGGSPTRAHHGGGGVGGVGMEIPDFSLVLLSSSSLYPSWTTYLRTIQLSFLGIPLLNPLGLLVEGLRASHNIRYLRLMIRRCHVSSTRGTVASLLGELIKATSQSKTVLALVLSCMAHLFSDHDIDDPLLLNHIIQDPARHQDEVLPEDGANRFLSACHDFPVDSGLVLRNVGVTEKFSTTLCRAMIKARHVPKSLSFLHVSGKGFMGPAMFEQLLTQLAFVGNIQRNLILVDKTETPPPELAANWETRKEELFTALSRNRHELPWIKLVLGGGIRFAKHKKADRKRFRVIQQSITELHTRTALAKEVLKIPRLISRGDNNGGCYCLLAHILAKLGDSDSGRDAVFLLLKNM
ncbi:hypothetical protein ACA910_007798 [Epithemia clementina (nom. ined.)]